MKVIQYIMTSGVLAKSCGYYTTAIASTAAPPTTQRACPVTIGIAALVESDVLAVVVLVLLVDVTVPTRVVSLADVVVVEEAEVPVEAEAPAVSVAVICTGMNPPYGIPEILKPVVIAEVEPSEVTVATQLA